MFLHLVNVPGNPANTIANAQALFQYHPLEIAALAETAWRNRQPGNGVPFDPWPRAITDPIIQAFPNPGVLQQGVVNWDHMIYAYCIENTRIFDIFKAVLDAYQHGEQLQIPGIPTQRFLRNLEFLAYSDPMPTTVWNLTSRTRQDEQADRMTNYWRAFGMELDHAAEISDLHPYQKPAASNVEFAPTVESLLREVWAGITNARNSSGANDTDNEHVRSKARNTYDMLISRRLHGNFSREEFRAVSIMSWLHLAVLFDSPLVADLRAEASSPEQRLAKIAERVGMQAHPQSQALFRLAQPLSFLMIATEQGLFNTPQGASSLYLNPRMQRLMETVIDQYGTATGQNLKARAPVVTQPQPVAKARSRLPAPARGMAPTNGMTASGQPALPAPLRTPGQFLRKEVVTH